MVRGDRLCGTQAEPKNPCPIVLLGVIGDPLMIQWRRLMRRQLSKMMEKVNGVTFDVRFAVANMKGCPLSARTQLRCKASAHPLDCIELKRENAEFHDVVQLPWARDCASRSGQAVAEKTFEWYAWAAQQHGVSWIGKFDDDSLPNMMKLARDMLHMEAAPGGVRRQTGARYVLGDVPDKHLGADRERRKLALRAHLHSDGAPPLFAYYGVMAWRMWSPVFRRGCGAKWTNYFTTTASAWVFRAIVKKHLQTLQPPACGVRLEQQLSKSSCVEGTTFGCAKVQATLPRHHTTPRRHATPRHSTLPHSISPYPT